ncbi:MAG: hypothetical protein KGK08_01445 [Acidobacteriota bacterium]|nr:hypothetical protein [Acidobacteriota bacterium]
MNTARNIVLAALTLSATLAAHGSSDKRITASQLPAPVLAIAQNETKGAIIKGYATEVENGARVYEVETVVAGHTRDLQIASDGTLNEIEEEVQFDSLSEPVRTSLMAKAKGARIVKVESLTKGGKLVAYEAATVRGTRHGEVQTGPSGETLSHEE